jgi:hypothetical protein
MSRIHVSHFPISRTQMSGTGISGTHAPKRTGRASGTRRTGKASGIQIAAHRKTVKHFHEPGIFTS